MITLAIDASTYAGTVSVLDGTRVIAGASIAMKGANEERLMPAVARVLTDGGAGVQDVRRVACGAGPGSFTSLRIAAAIAKGIALGIGAPLYAVPSLALVIGAVEAPPGNYLAALDALRGEFYTALFRVDEHRFVHSVDQTRLVLAVHLDRLAHELDATIVSPSRVAGGLVAAPAASAVSRLADFPNAYGPVDVARWEPAYGRLAEAQVRWESAHGRPLATG